MWQDVCVELLSQDARHGLADRVKKGYRTQVLWGVAGLIRLLQKGEPRIGPCSWD